MKSKYKRLFHIPSKSSCFILGVRGVGKSTWAEQHFGSCLWIDLLHETTYQRYLLDPENFIREIAAQPDSTTVVIDEIQRLPNLLNEVHRAIEKRKLRFILLGSSARKLRRAGTNLLGGRALQYIMDPLTPEELKQDFQLDHYLRYGGIPLITESPHPREQLEAYIQLYIRQEIQTEALVRNLPGFVRFLPIAAAFHGQILNLEGLGRDAGIARSTAEGYLEILEDSLLAFQVPAYQDRLRVKQRSHPKFYWIDPGIARAARSRYDAPTAEEQGVLLEGFIAQLLVTYKHLRRLDYDSLCYWAVGKTEVEVDLIIVRDNEVIAIEVKSSKSPKEPYFKGLKAFGERVKKSKKILIYRGDVVQRHPAGIEIWPVEKFLEVLEQGEL